MRHPSLLTILPLLSLLPSACSDGDSPGDDRWTDVAPVLQDQHRPFAVAADDTHVYWIEYTTFTTQPNRIFRAPRSGGATELLHAQVGGLQDLDVDAGGVYFLHGDGLERLPHGGGAPILLHDQGGGESLALQGDRIFWTVNDNHQGVFSVRTDGTDPQHHYTARVRHRIAVDDTHIYLGAESGDVLAQPYPGAAAPITVGSDTCATDVALGPSHVYWLSPDSCGVTGAEVLRRAPLAAHADPAAAEIADDQVWGLTGNGAEVLFTDSRNLWRVTDGAPTEVASVRDLTCHTNGAQTTCGGPTDLYLHPDGLYLCGWRGTAGGTGWLGFVARP